jgi:hypothetical protein
MPRISPVSLASLAVLASLTLGAACAKGEERDTAAGDTAGAAAGAPAASAAGSSADADLADLTRYRLTMDKVDRYFAAHRNLLQKVKDMSPAEREALEKSQESSSDANANLDDMVRNIERSPVYRDALRQAGLSPREYIMVTMAMFQAGMAASVVKMRPKDDPDSLAREMKVNPENLKFMQQHEAEITQKQKAMEEEAKRLGVKEGD